MRSASLLAVLCLAFTVPVTGTAIAAPVSFDVTFADAARPEPATGRLVVYLIREGANVGVTSPAQGPFWYDPQPLYGIDVTDLKPGEVATIDDDATAFGPRPSDLPPGRYRAQAVLDLHRSDSRWRREPGNLYSDVLDFEITADGEQLFALTLDNVMRARQPRPAEGMELFEVRSKRLSEFRGKDVMLRAAVVFPRDHDPNRSYAAVYEVPGFGDDHTSGLRARRGATRGPLADLQRNAFFITLDPESPNGHTLFADSAVNGPCGKALVSELIPALEAKYKLMPHPSARLLRGHSSGGWSVLWLTVRYPETFGACWSSSPDPVDFRRFELINIYDDANAYTDRAGQEIASTRSDGKVTLTVRGENQQEEVLGPDNSSAQQWDSWQAVFGTRDGSGWPTPLFDARTGKIDHLEAEHYKQYDISLLLRSNPQEFGPIFLQRVRLICGDADDFYLNEAVELLQEQVDKLQIASLPEGRHGYIKLLPGLNHHMVFGSEAMRAFPREMLDHLRRNGHAR